MVERFFCSSSSSSSSSTCSTAADSDASAITLLSGPPSCGKTSLLFQYALNIVAASTSGFVVFLCNRRRLEANPPILSQGIDSESHLFHRIQIKYVDDDEGIKKYFAAFHLLHPFPLAVIIDDFPDFFHHSICQQRYSNARGRDLAMVRVLALCQSAIIHANKTAPCKLLLSDTHHGDSPRLLFIYKRWISSIFTVEGDGSGSFLLKSRIMFKGNGTGERTARYSVALHHLTLEKIMEDERLIHTSW